MKKNNIYIGHVYYLLLLFFVLGCKETENKFDSANNLRMSFYAQDNVDKTPLANANEQNVTPPNFTATANMVLDAVVHIRSTQATTDIENTYKPRQLPDIFKDFFGDQFQWPENMPQQPVIGSGSGVIIDEKGYIVTNNHVINNAKELQVTLHDNETYEATVIGADPATDLALIQIKGSDLKALPFVDSDVVEIGEWVLAVGNPYSLYSTVTAGIISAKARNININPEKFAVESFIQTDAAINPGNSGGALVNLKGEIVGINTAIASRTGSYAGYGFAIPSNIVTKVIADLLEYGNVQRGMLGITIRTMNGNLAMEKKIDFKKGVWVEKVNEDSAAEKAGVKPGDIIVRIDGDHVTTSPRLQEIIAQHRPGDQLTLVVDRKGNEKQLLVTLENVKGSTELTKKENVEMLNIMGADFESISKETASKLDIEGGVKIVELYPGILRQKTQINTGFIITHVNNKKVNNIKDLAAELEKIKGGIMLEGIYEDIPGKYYYAFGLDN